MCVTRVGIRDVSIEVGSMQTWMRPWLHWFICSCIHIYNFATLTLKWIEFAERWSIGFIRHTYIVGQILTKRCDKRIYSSISCALGYIHTNVVHLSKRLVGPAVEMNDSSSTDNQPSGPKTFCTARPGKVSRRHCRSYIKSIKEFTLRQIRSNYRLILLRSPFANSSHIYPVAGCIIQQRSSFGVSARAAKIVCLAADEREARHCDEWRNGDSSECANV